jgi:hypothetical protein
MAPAPTIAAPSFQAPSAPIVHPVATPAPAPVSQAVVAKVGNGHDPNKLKIEIMRLENLVKKLQSELLAEREYSRSLEANIKAFHETGS